MSATWPPPIAEPELIERLAMDDEQFRTYITTFLAAIPPRICDEAAFEWACAYPWVRPAGSYLLSADGGVELLAELGERERERLIERHAAPDGERLPLLAIGSNAAPETLQRKFAHFPEPADRIVLAVHGRLHEFDVGYAAQPALYGALPATIFASPGTAVAAMLLWVTPTQFTQLTWSELSYRLGRLRTRFEVDDAGEHFDEVLVFVSRWGALTVDDAPVALAAVPAQRRTATALTQREVLELAAAMTLGPGTSAEELVHAVFSDLAGLGPAFATTLHRAGLPFASERWTPYAGGDQFPP
ncbi:MAG TPA: hypothetical protein VKB03_03135 [Conexibacter sp.]|nr:hypothetical protein [Conexibacter sp.]